MAHTVDDEQTSPYSPEAAEGAARTPRLPEPPRFDDLTPEEATRVRLISEQFAPKLSDFQEGQDAPHDASVQSDQGAQPPAFAQSHQAAPQAASSHAEHAAPALPVDDQATRPQPVVEPAAPAPLPEPAAAAEAPEQPTRPQPAVEAHPNESIFRAQSVATPSDPPSAEQQKLDAERAARREAREQALAQPDVRTMAAPEPVVITRRTTDRFLGSFALFVLRLVVAAILAVRGLGIVTDLTSAEALFATTILPEPRIAAIVTGCAALAIAVALVFGLLTRVAGLGVMLIAGGALAFVLWGNWSPFVAGRAGFIGELELLLAAVGLVFLCVGAGGFSLDRSFRKSRERDRPADQAL